MDMLASWEDMLAAEMLALTEAIIEDMLAS